MLLFRYIVKEHIFPFLTSLSIIIFLFIMQQAILMLDRIVSRNIDPIIILEVFLIQLGWILALGIPMAILSATLMTFGRMAGDNEITAIKASGRSMTTLVVPVMAAAAVITVALAFFHDLILPEANHRSATLLRDISRKRPAAFIEPGVLIRDFPDYALYVEDVNAINGNLTGIRVFSSAEEEDPMVTVAASGNIRMTGDGEYLVLSLTDGETHSASRTKDEYLKVRFDEQVIFIKNVDSQFERSDGGTRGDREKNIMQILADVRVFKDANDFLNNELAKLRDSVAAINERLDTTQNDDANNNVIGGANVNTNVNTRNANVNANINASGDTVIAQTQPTRPARRPTPPALERRLQSRLRQHEAGITNLENAIHQNNLLIAQNMVEVHKKFAIPAACLIFVLIGAPLGIMARRGGLAVGASYSVFFFVMYWVFLITGENWGDRLIVSPAVAMWSGNVFLLLCGVVLMILMLRETSISFAFVKHFFIKRSQGFKRFAEWKIFKIPGAIFSAPRKLLAKVNGILPAYLIGIFLGYAIGLIMSLLVVFVTIDYVSNLRRFENATYFEVALYYWYYLPWIAQTVLPIVLFLSAMFSMGRIAKTSELTAIKAAGVNVRRLTKPLLILGLILSAAVFFGGEEVIPKANEQRTLLRANFGRSQEAREASQTIREYRRDFYYFASADIMYVFAEFCTEPQFFRGVRRYKFTESGITQLIDATDMDFDSTGWRFLNVRVRTFTDSGMTQQTFVELDDDVLTAVPLDLVKRVRSRESMSYWELANHIEAARRRGEKVDKFMAELQFKIAFPFMNFIVILFGLSLAARTGRRGGAALFGVGLLLSFIFWMLSRFLLVFAQNGYLPTLVGAWLSNILFLIVGLIMYKKSAH